jgi:hypothetical protein
MAPPTVLFLHDDVTQINYGEASYHWIASQVGFRSIAADWRTVRVSTQGTSVKRGYEAVSSSSKLEFNAEELIHPDLIVHRKLIWGRSEVLIERLRRRYPLSLCSYHRHWRTIGDKWVTEKCMRKAERHGISVPRPATYLFEKHEMRARLREIGKSRPLIFKPASASECTGILLSLPQTFDEVLQNVLLSTWTSFVVQDLILDSPLYQGKKFDLRVYVLVDSFRPLRFRTFHEGVARIAAEPFTPCTAAEPLCALTGTSFRKRLGYPAHNLLITDALAYLRDKGFDVDNFWTDVDALMTNVLSAFAEYPLLARERDLGGRFYFAGMDLLMVPKGKGFELLFVETNYVPQLADWGGISLAPVHHQLIEDLQALSFGVIGSAVVNRRLHSLTEV